MKLGQNHPTTCYFLHGFRIRLVLEWTLGPRTRKDLADNGNNLRAVCPATRTLGRQDAHSKLSNAEVSASTESRILTRSMQRQTLVTFEHSLEIS